MTQAVSSIYVVAWLRHSYADVQIDLAQELHWDMTALQALTRLTEDEAVEERAPGGKAGLLPSLHLNLADVYRRLGDEIAAQHHHFWRSVTSRAFLRSGGNES